MITMLQTDETNASINTLKPIVFFYAPTNCSDDIIQSDLFLVLNESYISLDEQFLDTDYAKVIPSCLLSLTHPKDVVIDRKNGFNHNYELLASTFEENCPTCCISLDVWESQYLKTWLFKSRQLRKGFCCFCKSLSKNSSFKKRLRILINDLSKTNSWLDYIWSYKICGLVCRSVVLDDAMNWLNTLGGGYSALGDHFEYHALEAGKISLKQLKIGMEMGDPLTVIRCRLYLSLSFMQTGGLRRAKYILREQYYEAKRFSEIDKRLVNMCKGLWSRLSYLYSKRKLAVPS